MNNYEKMLADALRRFTTYDRKSLATRKGVEDHGSELTTSFLKEEVRLDPCLGQIFVGGRRADFGETLSVLDWLCDADPDAGAAGEYCTVSSLPGVLVSGSGLTISGHSLAQRIHEDPERFQNACAAMEAEPVAMGDLGYRVELFPGLYACLKFYFGDEEFPPQLTLLWDRNILQFVRYETVYYIAGCLLRRMQRLM